jgi:hypothetical protein
MRTPTGGRSTMKSRAQRGATCSIGHVHDGAGDTIGLRDAAELKPHWIDQRQSLAVIIFE